MERQIDSSRLRTGYVIRASFEDPTDPSIVDEQIFWIRGNNGERDLFRRVLKVEDQLGRSSEAPVVDILDGRYGSYRIEGVYSPRELRAVDPRLLNSGSAELSIDEDKRLESIDPSKLGPNSRLRVSSIGDDNIVADEFNARIVAEILDKEEKVFVMEDEFGNIYDIPEKDILNGMHDGWMRFDGVIPNKKNKVDKSLEKS